MKFSRRHTIAAALGLTSGAVLIYVTFLPGGTPNTAPGPGPDAASDKILNRSVLSGGELRLWSDQGRDSWDPARTSSPFVHSMHRLYARTLLTYTSAPGTKGLQLRPDLAMSLPTVSADGKTYTFSLRQGLKYEDGAPILAKDIKYGIERNFDPKALPGASRELFGILDPGGKYTGPSQGSGDRYSDLKSIEVPTDKTIVFHLTKPFADLPALMARGESAPVPRVKDSGEDYGVQPVSSGPYKFQSKRTGNKITLVRNTYWSRGVDSIRRALPDTVNLTFGSGLEEFRKAVADGAYDHASLNEPEDSWAALVNDQSLKNKIDNTPSGTVRFGQFNAKSAPFQNLHCRRAVLYATNPKSTQAALGGSSAASMTAQLLPPGTLGSDPPYDPYHLTAAAAQPKKAQQELRACGKEKGFTTKISVAEGDPRAAKAAEALVSAMKPVGIRATIEKHGGPSGTDPGQDSGVILSSGSPSYASAGSFLRPLVAGGFSPADAGPAAADPVVSGLLEKAARQTDPYLSADIYRQVNRRIMDQAWYLPISYDKTISYRSERLTNAYMHSAYRTLDFQALGIFNGGD
ncbi:ABC transporter substrate-binding protein [Streptomyces sp. NPDC051909]|uniref:ABC transporter substrate-binding protein n=1 Tax=Streptomyces sp. NPDC051909 TaxID=3154944 RepID=UPI00344AE3DD